MIASQEPLVSIICNTYNHENYIRDAIEGFLMQETDFPFEIIIHDDASTDKTADIVREYEKKYPDLIKPIYQTENQYSKGCKINSTFNFPRAKGKYIAFCEGDDFWVDPKKLSIQVNFLENNPDYVISGHDAFIIDDKDKIIKTSKLPDSNKRDFSGEELILGKPWILTLSWVSRNINFDIPKEMSMVVNVDTFLTSLMGHYGKSKYHPEIKPAGYRVHSGGIWSSLDNLEKRNTKINTIFWMYRYYNRINEKKYADFYWQKYTLHVVNAIETNILVKELTLRLLSIKQIKSKISSWIHT